MVLNELLSERFAFATRHKELKRQHNVEPEASVKERTFFDYIKNFKLSVDRKRFSMQKCMPQFDQTANSAPESLFKSGVY